jgi:hypothetical protein
MKVFAVPRFVAVKPRSQFRTSISEQFRRVVHNLVAVNGRIDEARARRDRANHDSGTVDSAFWIFLR